MIETPETKNHTSDFTVVCDIYMTTFVPVAYNIYVTNLLNNWMTEYE